MILEHDLHIQKVHKALLYEVGNHRHINHDLFIVKKHEVMKKNTTNPSIDPSFLIKLHPIPSPLEVTTIMTPNNHFLAFTLWFFTTGIGIS